MNFHSSIIHNSQKETTQMSIANKWIVYSYNRISFGQKEKWGTDAFYNVHEPWEHHTEKPVVKEHVLYDSLSIKCPEKPIYKDKKQISDGLGLEVRT